MRRGPARNSISVIIFLALLATGCSAYYHWFRMDTSDLPRVVNGYSLVAYATAAFEGQDYKKQVERRFVLRLRINVDSTSTDSIHAKFAKLDSTFWGIDCAIVTFEGERKLHVLPKQDRNYYNFGEMYRFGGMYRSQNFGETVAEKPKKRVSIIVTDTIPKGAYYGLPIPDSVSAITVKFPYTRFNSDHMEHDTLEFILRRQIEVSRRSVFD